MKLAVALSAAALAATALVAPPAASAAPAPAAPAGLVKKSFIVYSKFTSRQVVAYGGANNIGDLTVTQGTVTDTSGKKVGTLTAVVRVIAPSPKKDAELRDTQSSVTLKDGTIFAQAVNEDPKGKPPETLHIMPVTGGTGAYAGARGTLNMYKVGDKYLMAYDVFVEKDLKTRTFSFDNIVDGGATGGAVQGIGDLAMLHGTGPTDSYILLATRAGDAGGVTTDAVDMQVYTTDGSLFARAIARGKSGPSRAATFAVLGGTGSLSGYRGELTLSANGLSISAKLAPSAGSSKPLNWLETTQSPTVVDITGGSFLAAEGTMYSDAQQKKKLGDYFASQTTYDEIDGLTPIVTMLEQDFKTGTMLVTGITLSTGADGQAVVRPIIGGTGDYGGAAGQVTSAQSGALWRKSARFWR